MQKYAMLAVMRMMTGSWWKTRVPSGRYSNDSERQLWSEITGVRTVNDKPIKTMHEVNISANTAHSQSVVPVVNPISACDGFELMLENVWESGTVSMAARV